MIVNKGTEKKAGIVLVVVGQLLVDGAGTVQKMQLAVETEQEILFVEVDQAVEAEV